MSTAPGFVASRHVVIASIAAVVSWCMPASAAPVPTSRNVVTDEPITPVPKPRPANELKVALGERLFRDVRLSRDDTRSCITCHDLSDNAATRNVSDLALDGSPLRFNTTSIFNSTLSFRLGWEGEFRSLEAQAEATLANPAIMDSSAAQVVAKLAADPEMVRQFQKAYGSEPDAKNLLNALATFERSLVTPDSRFDRWLKGDATALSTRELSGYRLFKSLGCVACHQGVNVGGNLFQRHGIFRPLVSSGPEVVRVPSLRNVATTAPYFHDGSAPTLNDAVMRMAASQLNSTLTVEQAEDISAFLGTLTGSYRGRRVGASQ